MNRKEIILAGLSTGNCDLYTPVQVQKLFFLLDRNIAQKTGGPHFNFEAYNYGPFDKAVYTTLEELAKDGDVEIVSQNRWLSYKLSTAGQSKGQDLLSHLPPEIHTYIKEVSEFVRRLSFAELVTAIYSAYPEMRVNSVFQS